MHNAITSDNHSRPNVFQLGAWVVDVDRQLVRSVDDKIVRRVEPKVLALLVLLVDAQNQVVSRATLIDTLWSSTVVGEDTLARTVSRLRALLDDSAEQATYIETIPKHGYRLVKVRQSIDVLGPSKPVQTIWLVTGSLIVFFLIAIFVSQQFREANPGDPELVQRADDYYMRFSRADNEAAIELYQKVLLDNPEDPQAQSGLANALVQRLVRWPQMANVQAVGQNTLADALGSGQLSDPDARLVLERAVNLAERAARTKPLDSLTLKALGFSYAASGRLEDAADVYRRAIEANSDAWRSQINLGEILLIWQEYDQALDYFQQAYAAMQRQYANEPHNVGPWQPAVGAVVAGLYRKIGEDFKAEFWYRRVLDLAPFEPQATAGLAALLRDRGESPAASRLCRALERRTGSAKGCDSINSTSLN